MPHPELLGALDEPSIDFLIEEAERRNLPIPPELSAKMLEREALRRGIVTGGGFRDFVQTVNPSLLRFEHVPKLIDVGERVVQRKLDRVLVLMPPRHFKSEIFSKLLPAYYLSKHVRAKVAISSYTAHLAWELSEAARENYARSGGALHERDQSKQQWSTALGGVLWAVGMGGTLLGRGFHLGIVDDPINPQHAASVLYQRRFAHWWPDVWLSRQDPHMPTGRQLAQILVVMQRLGPSDPIDYLFRREVGEQMAQSAERWHVVILDEIKSDEPLGRWSGPRGLPPTCTVEPDDRPVGQVLAPSLFSVEAVKSAQEGAGPLAAAAQRQQRPMQATGAFWRSDWFQATYEHLPGDAYDGGTDWDTAYSQEEDNSASAMIRSFRGPAPRNRPDDFPIYVDDVDWRWVEFPGLVEWMAAMKGPHFVEQKASGKSAVQAIRKYGIAAKEVTVTGDKLARASQAQPVVAQGRVHVSARVVQKLLWGELQGLLRVTAEGLQAGGAGLDVNDAFVQAIFRHTGLASKKYKVMVR